MLDKGHFITGELFVTITNQDVKNVALNKTATASSQTDSNNPKYTIDGKLNTRWASKENDTEFITIDLHGLYTIDQITLNWETAYGKKYLLQGSLDGENFFELYHQENGQGHIENIYFNEATVRYVRMQGIQRGTNYGYSLYEFEVYGKSCKADLQSLYEKYRALDESLYTPESYKDFVLILDDAKTILENEAATLDEIQTVSQSLENAFKNLVLKADKTVLEKVIVEAEKLDSSLYTPTSYQVLKNTLNQAKIVLNDENISTDDVAKVLSQLQESMTSLVKRADTVLLQTIINQAKAIDNQLYTKTSIQKLNMILSQVEKIYENKDATQKQVDEAVKDLNAAIKGLVKKADKKALEEAIQEVKAIDTKLYTDETVKVLTAVLKEAKEIYKDENATQETVAAIVKKLQEAVDSLEEKEVDIVVTPDKPDENKPDENKPGEPEQNNNQPTTEEKVETSDNTQYQMYIALLG
ncbi:discoidin domain-containing protein, partial [Longibaculum muris]|uniref:discoidin domain-containing protein n=1 Tax=Longibaculum muris TaxID=1796628 RepID=UPI003AB6A7EF